MNALVRAALEASPPRDLSLRRDVRGQTPSGRITRLITARRRAAPRPRRSGRRAAAAGSVTSCGLPLVLIMTHKCRRQLLVFLFVFFLPPPSSSRPLGPLPLTQPAAPLATHGIGLSLWIMSAIKERKRKKNHARARTARFE